MYHHLKASKGLKTTFTWRGSPLLRQEVLEVVHHYYGCRLGKATNLRSSSNHVLDESPGASMMVT